ncbi:MAG: hypothetical protein ACWGQW_00680 [bacterium]
MGLHTFGLGDESDEVKEVQTALLQLGYDLPKHGASGVVTLELYGAIEDFWVDHCDITDSKMVHEEWNWHDDQKVVDMAFARILEVREREARLIEGAPATGAVDVDFHDITDAHPRKAAKGVRRWKDVNGITLHQTGIMLGNTLKRFQSLKAHIGILKLMRPTIVQVYPLNTLLHHGNAFNSTDVGIEVNGCFEGIDGNIRTAWKGGYKKAPHRATDEQIIATREAVRRIIHIVDSHGGAIEAIHAHRQTSATRRSDPGSRLWQMVGVWAQVEFGLSDGGDGFTVRDGLAIPREWDDRRTASY